MQRFRFPIAVAATSLAIVLALGVAGVLAVQTTLAGAPWFGGGGFGPRFGPPGFAGHGFELPGELKGLAEIPPAERFSHFLGVQVNLKDKDNQPLTATVTPGVVTAASEYRAEDGTVSLPATARCVVGTRPT